MLMMNLQLFAQEAPVQEPAEAAPKEATVEERLAKMEAMVEAMNKEALSKEPEPSYAQALKEKEEQLRQANAKAILARLQQQEAEARELYPKLSLKEEMKDPRFVELLKCGVDVRSAFEVIHKDQIISASMEYAARQVERMMTNKLLAEGSRPTENGGNHGPAVSKVDVKAMTRQERKDMIRRVRMGERITF